MSSPQQNEKTGAGPNAKEANNVDKIRDILFGNQMRDYDGKFAKVEERLNRDAADLRDDVKRRLASLESFVKGELSALLDQLRVEKEERLQGSKALAAELKNLAKTIEERLQQTDAKNEKAHRELREQILAEANRLGEEIRQKAKEGEAALSRESTDLRATLTHRQDLAELFAQMALHLRGGKAGKQDH